MNKNDLSKTLIGLSDPASLSITTPSSNMSSSSAVSPATRSTTTIASSNGWVLEGKFLKLIFYFLAPLALRPTLHDIQGAPSTTLLRHVTLHRLQLRRRLLLFANLASVYRTQSSKMATTFHNACRNKSKWPHQHFHQSRQQESSRKGRWRRTCFRRKDRRSCQLRTERKACRKMPIKMEGELGVFWKFFNLKIKFVVLFIKNFRTFTSKISNRRQFHFF